MTRITNHQGAAAAPVGSKALRKRHNASEAPTQYVPRAEAAAILGCSGRHLERLAKEGSGPPFRLNGNRAVYPVADLNEWARAQLRCSTSASEGAQAPAVAA
jgi:hypothetical protein